MMNIKKLKEGLADGIGEILCIGIVIIFLVIHLICSGLI